MPVCSKLRRRKSLLAFLCARGNPSATPRFVSLLVVNVDILPRKILHKDCRRGVASSSAHGLCEGCGYCSLWLLAVIIKKF